MKDSSAVLRALQEHFRTIPNRLLFAISNLQLGLIRVPSIVRWRHCTIFFSLLFQRYEIIGRS